MTFEEKLSEMYNEIANKISSMIPVEWEKVYTMAYIDDGGGEVFFNYTKPNSDELNYYTDIPKEYNISVQVFDDLWMDLYDLFEELRNLFKEEGLEPWTSCEFDFTREGKLKVSFDYIDWINSEFGQIGRQITISIENLEFYQKRNMKLIKLKKSNNILKSKKKLNNRGDNMTFEEKLSEMYNEIANKISSMIPVEWEKVYAMAYIDEECGEVFYNYTEPSSDELFYYTSVIKKYNLLKSSFMDSVYELHDQFEELREIFKEEGLEPWTSCEFDFTSEGKLNVSFDYIDWTKLEFGQIAKENYYMYIKFGILPETEYEINKVKEIEQYIKEQEE